MAKTCGFAAAPACACAANFCSSNSISCALFIHERLQPRKGVIRARARLTLRKGLPDMLSLPASLAQRLARLAPPPIRFMSGALSEGW